MANQWCECCGEREAMTGYRVCSVCQTNSAVEQKKAIEALRAENEALRERVEALESVRRSLYDMREVSDYRPSDSGKQLRARLDNLDHQIGNMIFNLDQQVKS